MDNIFLKLKANREKSYWNDDGSWNWQRVYAIKPIYWSEIIVKFYEWCYVYKNKSDVFDKTVATKYLIKNDAGLKGNSMYRTSFFNLLELKCNLNSKESLLVNNILKTNRENFKKELDKKIISDFKTQINMFNDKETIRKYNELLLFNDSLESDNVNSLDDELCEYERYYNSKQRIGQGKFRKAIMELHRNKCFVTEMEFADELEQLIVASHIVAWSECKEDKSNLKLNPYNGIPLIASIDKLFDNHLISFDELGRLYISKKIKEKNNYKEILKLCGIPDDYINGTKSVYEKEYLNEDSVNKIKENMKFHYMNTITEE